MSAYRENAKEQTPAVELAPFRSRCRGCGSTNTDVRGCAGWCLERSFKQPSSRRVIGHSDAECGLLSDHMHICCFECGYEMAMLRKCDTTKHASADSRWGLTSILVFIAWFVGHAMGALW